MKNLISVLVVGMMGCGGTSNVSLPSMSDSGLMYNDAGCVIYNEVDGQVWTLCNGQDSGVVANPSLVSHHPPSLNQPIDAGSCVSVPGPDQEVCLGGSFAYLCSGSMTPEKQNGSLECGQGTPDNGFTTYCCLIKPPTPPVFVCDMGTYTIPECTDPNSCTQDCNAPGKPCDYIAHDNESVCVVPGPGILAYSCSSTSAWSWGPAPNQNQTMCYASPCPVGAECQVVLDHGEGYPTTIVYGNCARRGQEPRGTCMQVKE